MTAISGHHEGAPCETGQQPATIASEIGTAVRQMATYGLGGILIKAVGFAMLPFYTHYLSPADYGILEILDLSMSLFALVLNMGLTPAFLRCYAAAKTEQEKRSVVSSGCIFAVVTGVCTFLIGLGLVRPVSSLIFGPHVPATYVLLSFSSIVMGYMANLPRTYLRALDQSGTYTVVDTVHVFLLLGFNIFFISVLRIGLSGVLWSSVICGAAQFVLMTGWAFRRAGFRFHWPYLERMLKYGIPLIFANGGLFVLNFSDRFFLQHLRSLETVGVYAVGYKFGYMMNFLIVQPFFVMWQSRMFAIHSQPEHLKIFRQLFSMYSVGMIYAGLAMALFSPEVVRMMVERKFAASQDVIPVVVLAYVFYGLSYYAQLGLFLTDNTRRIGLIGAGAAVLNLGLNYVLISRYGMMGAAWATALSFAFMAVVSYLWSQRVFRLPLGVGRMSLAMMLGIGMYILSRWLTPEAGLTTIVAKLLIIGAFPVAVWKSGILLPSAAATLLSAGEGALASMGRLYAGIARRAPSQ